MDNYRILIAEDEAVNSIYIQRILKLKGYTVAGITSTGEDTINISERTRPDLILMDIKLQGDMDGINAAKKIKEKYDIPIIYLTAHEDDDILERAKTTDPFGYIIKPINKFELYSAIEIARHKHLMGRQLKESEERFRSLIESLNDTVFSVNNKGIFTFISHQIKSLTGYETSEITGKHISDFIEKEDIKDINKIFINYDHDQIIARDIRIKSKDGRSIWTHISGKPFYKNNKLEIRGVITDITKRKKMEEALQRSNQMMEQSLSKQAEELLDINDELYKEEALLDSIIKLNPYSISIYDSNGNFIMGNKSYILLFGSIPHTEYSLFDDHVLKNEGLKESLISIKVGMSDKMHFEVTYKPDDIKEGVPFKKLYLRGIFFSIKNRYDKIEYIVAIHEDISKQKKAEQTIKKAHDELEMRVKERTCDLEEANKKLHREIEDRRNTELALMESEEKYMSLFENSMDGVYIHEFNGKFIDVNNSFLNMLGYTIDELKNISFKDLLDTDQKELSSNSIEEIKKSGINNTTTEYKFQHKNGLHVYVETSGSIFFRENEPAGILGIARNVTERKKTEEKTKSSLREKEILLKEIHHRVKNNMQIISSILSLQADYIIDERDRDLFRESQNRVYSMSLVHEKLYNSNNLAEIDFKEYINEFISELLNSYFMESQNVNVNINVHELNLSIDSAIPTALIINELVSNSFKYAFKGKKDGEVNISIAKVNGSYKLSISDNGPGLPETINFKETNTLGLQLVNALTNQLNGELHLENNNGLKYTITFPDE